MLDPYELETYRHLNFEIDTANATYMPVIVLTGVVMMGLVILGEIVWQVACLVSASGGVLSPYSAELVHFTQMLSLVAILTFFSGVGFWAHLETTVHKNAAEIRRIGIRAKLVDTYEQRKFSNPLRKLSTPLTNSLMTLCYLFTLGFLMYRVNTYWQNAWIPWTTLIVLTGYTVFVLFKVRQYVESFQK